MGKNCFDNSNFGKSSISYNFSGKFRTCREIRTIFLGQKV